MTPETPWWFREDAGLTLDDWARIHSHCPILAKLHAMTEGEAHHYSRHQPGDEQRRQVFEQMSIQRLIVARAVLVREHHPEAERLSHDWTYTPGKLILTLDDAL